MDADGNSAEYRGIDGEHGEQPVNVRRRQRKVAAVTGLRA
jgi:hypothetical protein